MNTNETRLHVFALGLALGITWGVGMLITGLSAWFFGWGGAFVTLMSSVYYGFGASLVGSLAGAVWGFVDAFIGGIVIAWLYNLCVKCCSR